MMLHKLYSFVFIPLSYLKFWTNKIQNTPSNKFSVVISLHRIGDTIFTLPTIRFLYEKFNDNLFVICYKSNTILYKKFISAKLNIIEISDEHIFNKLQIVKKINLPTSQFENVFDLTNTILSFSIVIRLRYINSFGLKTGYFDPIYTKITPKNTNGHLMSMYFNMLDSYTKNISIDKYYSFPLKSFEVVKIVINPFGGWPAKEWEFNKYIELAILLSEFYYIEFIIEVKRFNETIKSTLNRNNIEYSVSGSLENLIDRYKDFSLFIGNDSGPLYLAALCGLATFTIYGPTNPEYSFPPSGTHAYIQQKVYCSPETNHQYCNKYGGQVGCFNFICMNTLLVEDVYSKIVTFIHNELNKK